LQVRRAGCRTFPRTACGVFQGGTRVAGCVDVFVTPFRKPVYCEKKHFLSENSAKARFFGLEALGMTLDFRYVVIKLSLIGIRVFSHNDFRHPCGNREASCD
jgi:hypothetical protein